MELADIFKHPSVNRRPTAAMRMTAKDRNEVVGNDSSAAAQEGAGAKYGANGSRSHAHSAAWSYQWHRH